MSGETLPITHELRYARRFFDGHQELKLIEDWTWYLDVKRWGLCFRASPAGIPPDSPLYNTIWYVTVEPLYPWGEISVWPSKIDGINMTYPHQNANGTGDEALPWRAGKLCLVSPLRVLGRGTPSGEPLGDSDRLQWHLERALVWLEAAYKGVLLAPGDPYEAPDLPVIAPEARIGFAETASSFGQWGQITTTRGTVELTQIGAGNLLLCKQFTQRRLGPVVVAPTWGSVTENQRSTTGIWVRLKRMPILPPWQLPISWGELRAVCTSNGDDLDAKLCEVAPRIRDGQPHILLLGCPIPEVIDGPLRRLTWLGIQLPILGRTTQTIAGFRPNARGNWLYDRRSSLTDTTPIRWIRTANWAPEYLESRGRLPDAITEQRIAIIGCGALGSALAELLARGGIRHMTLIDGQQLEPGNLIRHTLSVHDIGTNKAKALARRLMSVAPHLTVHPIADVFPPENPPERQTVQACDFILDCTADDSLLEQLAVFPWDGAKRFAILSLGYHAKRLWCYIAGGERFPHEDFDSRIAPWLEREQEEFPTMRFPREGIGCWHPVFPAQWSDILFLAAAVVKYLAGSALDMPSTPRLAVFSQQVLTEQLLQIATTDGTHGAA